MTVRDSWDRDGEALRRAAAWSGVETCVSVWSCPVCAPRVRSDRARAIAMLDAWARSEGWQVTMLTLTVRHALGDDLRRMRTQMSDAWAALQRLTTWRTLLGDGAYFIRALEATYGAHGWHSHFHVLVLSPVVLETELRPARREGDPDVAHVVQAERFVNEWKRVVSVALGPKHVPNDEHGVDWREIAAGDYIAKLDLAMGIELTDAAGTKRAKNGGRKPAEILRDARAHALTAAAARKRGDHAVAAIHERARRHDVAVYGEYERAMVGARLHTASAGLLKFWQAIADDERDDETIVAHVLTVPGELYDLLRDVPDALAGMATRCEADAPHEGVADWLRSLGTRAIHDAKRRTSMSGWEVRDERTRTLDGPRWAGEWSECNDGAPPPPVDRAADRAAQLAARARWDAQRAAHPHETVEQTARRLLRTRWGTYDE